MADMSKDLKTIAEASQVLVRTLDMGIELAQKMLSAWLKQKETRDFASMILKGASKPENRDAILVSKYISEPDIINTMNDILKREAAAGREIDGEFHSISQPDLVPDGKLDNTVTTGKYFTFFSTQEDKVDLLISEAYARTGLASELSQDTLKKFSGKLENNKVYHLQNMTVTQYEGLRNGIANLDKDMRFTLFTERNEDGTYDIAFLERTEPKAVRDERGLVLRNSDNEVVTTSYNIPEMVKSIMINEKMLENSRDAEEYNHKLEANTNYRENALNDIMNKDQYFALDDIYTAVNNSSIKYDDKMKIIESIARYDEFPSEKDNLYNLLKNCDLDIKEKGKFLRNLSEIGKAVYVVPASIMYNPETNEQSYRIRSEENSYMVVGQGITIRQPGKNDIRIPDRTQNPEGARANIDKFMKDCQVNDKSTFLVLTEQEFKKSRSLNKRISEIQWKMDQINIKADKSQEDIDNLAQLRAEKTELYREMPLNKNTIESLEQYENPEIYSNQLTNTSNRIRKQTKRSIRANKDLFMIGDKDEIGTSFTDCTISKIVELDGSINENLKEEYRQAVNDLDENMQIEELPTETVDKLIETARMELEERDGQEEQHDNEIIDLR